MLSARLRGVINIAETTPEGMNRNFKSVWLLENQKQQFFFSCKFVRHLLAPLCIYKPHKTTHTNTFIVKILIYFNIW